MNSSPRLFVLVWDHHGFGASFFLLRSNEEFWEIDLAFFGLM